jgi:hypothetical protein
MAHNIHLRATTRLPGLDIEVVHRRSPGRDREEFSVNLHAVVGFQPWGFFSGAGQSIFGQSIFIVG